MVRPNPNYSVILWKVIVTELRKNSAEYDHVELTHMSHVLVFVVGKKRLSVGGLRAPHSHNVETINHRKPWRATCDFLV